MLARHRGGSEAAITGLLGFLADLQGDVPVSALRSTLTGVVKDRRRHPLVRSYAAYLQGRLIESDGAVASAQKAFADQGYLLRWQIMGPFDNAGRAGETTAYPPEREPFVADQAMFGKLAGEALTWRTYDYEGIPRGAYISLDDVLRPNEQVTGYATAWVRVKKPTAAALHIGAGGAYTAWVGGRKVGEGSAYRAPHPLQDAHGLRLTAGWNRILVKVSAMEGMWGFYARLSAPDGRPLPALEVAAAPPPPGAKSSPTTGAVAADPPPTVAHLGTALQKAWDRRPGAATGMALAEHHRWVHPFDHRDKAGVELLRAIDDKVAAPRTAWLLAIVDRDPSTSRSALVRGIERARKGGRAGRGLLAQMLLELAWRDRSLGLEERYRDLIDEAAAAAPDDALVELALIDRTADDGFPWLALQWARDAVGRYPKSRTLRGELATRLMSQGRTKEGLTILETLAAEPGGGHSLSGQRIGALLDLGRADEAVDVARRAVAASPGLPSAYAELARLQQARGDLPAARAALAKATSLAPQDEELHAAMGRLLARTGDRSGAVASLRRSLSLRPQQPEVRDLLASLDRGAQGDLLRRYGVDLSAVAKTATPKSWKSKDAGVLHNLVAVRVLPNGLTERLEHRIVRILDDRGVRSQSVQAISYDPAESTIEVRRARVHRKDGTVEELGQTRVVAMAQAGFRMYYDQRQARVYFPGLRVGDTVEVAFLRRDVAARNMFDEYFGDMVPLQGVQPQRRVEYVLEAPADKPLYFNKKIKRRKSKDGKRIVYRYVARNVPGIKPENGMPGWTEFADYLHVSTYKGWDDVGNWYWDLVREQLVVDAEIRKAVATVVAALPPGADDRAKVHAIYEYVVRNTRYVGLEFGIHGYKPYRTTDVFSRRFGDCKDKASLLKVMLAEAGVDSHLVLVRTRDQGTLPTSPASLAAFNHAITYVPGLKLFLDGTAEWSGPEELPAGDQGATALIVRDGKGAEFLRIPGTKAADNTRTVGQTVALAPKGAAQVEHVQTVTGAAAAGVRFQFQSPEQRRERVGKAFGSLYPGVEVSDVAAPAIGDIKRPAVLEAKLSVPDWGRENGDRLRFSVLGRRSNLAGSLAPQAQRIHPLVLEVPSTERHDIQYRLPRGHTFTQMPQSRRIDGELGRFELKIERDGTGARVRSSLQIKKNRIDPAKYGEFREFLRQVDAALEQTFEVGAER